MAQYATLFDRSLTGADHVGFPFAREIRKPHGVIELVLEWCKSELTAEWRWQLIDVSSMFSQGRYCFFFDSERDLLAFTMKWC